MKNKAYSSQVEQATALQKFWKEHRIPVADCLKYAGLLFLFGTPLFAWIIPAPIFPAGWLLIGLGIALIAFGSQLGDKYREEDFEDQETQTAQRLRDFLEKLRKEAA